MWRHKPSSPPNGDSRGPLLVGLVTLLIECFFVFGCSEEVPIAPPAQGPFTMFGIINPSADTQAVVVYPIQQETLRPIGPERLDAVVTSTDLTSGEVRIWRDSVVSEQSIGYAHIFWSDFRAEPARTYGVEVERSDGAVSSVVVHVPDTIHVEAQDDGRPTVQVRFRGDRFRLARLEVVYGVGVDTIWQPACRAPGIHYVFSYAGRETRHENGWGLTIDLREYVTAIRQFLAEARFLPHPSADVSLYGLRLDVLVADEAWILPRGNLNWNAPRLEHGLDWSLLSHPELLTNVENGLGFVGAGYRTEEDLHPSAEAVRQAGLIDCVARP